MRNNYAEIVEETEMQGFNITPADRPDPLHTLSGVAIASINGPHGEQGLDAGDLSPDEFDQYDEEIEEAEEI